MWGVSEKPKQTPSSARHFGESIAHLSESIQPYFSESTRPRLNETSSEIRFEDYSLPSVSKFTFKLEEIDECTSPREVTITKIVKFPSTDNIVEYTTTRGITAAKVNNANSPFTMKSTFPNKDDPPSDMHKIFGSGIPKPHIPVCVHPFGWNVKGASAFIPAPSQRHEASDPLIETYAPSAPTLEDIVDD